MAEDDLEIRTAGAGDRAALETVLLEATRHYWGERDGDRQQVADTADALLSGRSGCTALIAWQKSVPVGFATVTVLHPGLSADGTFFLKDLYVSGAARGAGLGRRMMRHLAAMAVALGCRRFDWTAETDNPRAIAFYEDLGAARVEEKVYFRFVDEALAAFAEGTEQA